MEKYILITAVVIMIIILALDFIFSKDGYQCHSCKKHFHKEDLEIKGWHTKDWTCPHCKYQNVTLKSYDY
jgi:DNA-directed RNA polymerase subunit RPC12/RpoP